MSGKKIDNLTITLCENTSPDLEKLINNAMSFYYKPESKVRRTDVIENGLKNMVERKEVYTAFYENKLVGCVDCKMVDGVVFLGMLCVDKMYNNLGIGTALVRFIENMFPENSKFGLDVLYHKDLEIGDMLMAWYHKLGYEIVKTENCYDSYVVYEEIKAVVGFERFLGVEYKSVVDQVYRFTYDSIIMEKIVKR